MDPSRGRAAVSAGDGTGSDGGICGVGYCLLLGGSGRHSAAKSVKPGAVRSLRSYLDSYSEVVELSYHLASTTLAAAELARAKIASESLTILAALKSDTLLQRQAIESNRSDQILSDSDRRTVASEFFLVDSEGRMRKMRRLGERPKHE